MKNLNLFLIESLKNVRMSRLSFKSLPGMIYDLLTGGKDDPKEVTRYVITYITGQLPNPGADDDISEDDYKEILTTIEKIVEKYQELEKLNKSMLDDFDADLKKAEEEADKKLDELMKLIEGLAEQIKTVYSEYLTESVNSYAFFSQTNLFKLIYRLSGSYLRYDADDNAFLKDTWKEVIIRLDGYRPELDGEFENMEAVLKTDAMKNDPVYLLLKKDFMKIVKLRKTMFDLEINHTADADKIEKDRKDIFDKIHTLEDKLETLKKA